MTRASAAILLIGNELLSGKVRDENAHYLAGELFRMGVELRRTVVVPDESAEVVEALRDLLDRVDFVFTSGGIGPTHDDITVAAVAEALGKELAVHPRLEARAREFFGEKLGPEHLRMTRVPRDAVLVEGEKVRWPVLVIDRVFVLAGIPTIFRRGFEAIRDRMPTAAAATVASVFVMTDEWSLTPILERTVEAFPDVMIGSYPDLTSDSFRVRVTLEAVDEERVAAATDHFVDALPDGVLVRRDDL